MKRLLRIVIQTAWLPLLACSATAGPRTAPVTAPSTFDQAHTLWGTVLRQHVHADRFDYGALKADRADFDAYLASLHAVAPAEIEQWTEEQRFAFWINVYNAHTIQRVIDDYPLESIRDLDKAFGLKSVFDSEFIPMQAHHPAGTNDRLSLNDVEHKILRERFEDARVHAAINCASFSCPPLLGEAFVAEQLDQQLDAQMRAFVADRVRNPIDREKGTMRLSKIFDWFEDDFERDAGSVREYLIRFADPEDAAFLQEAKLKSIDYSWELNDVERS